MIAGNLLGLVTTPWIDFLAAFGGILLTFLAGAEVDPTLLHHRFRESVVVGGLSFLLPFVAAGLFAHFVAGWDLRQSEIAGVALSTTSLAVVYAVLVETGLTETEIGKIIMAATFVTDLGTASALSILFIQPTPYLPLFVLASVVIVMAMLALQPWFFRRYGDRVIEPEIKGAFVALLVLMWTADLAKSHAVLPAFLLGLAVSRVFRAHREQQKREPHCSGVGPPAAARVSWREDRGEVRGGLPACASLAATPRDLYNAAHEHRPRLRDDLVAIWTECGDHRPYPILGADHHGDPLRRSFRPSSRSASSRPPPAS